MRKRTAALLAALAILLTGCWDMTGIEDTVYAASVAVDAAGDEYTWTFRLVQAEKLVLGMLAAVPGDPGRLASGFVSVRSPSLEQAVHMVQPSLGRILSLEHVRSVLLSEEVARKGVNPLLSQMLRNTQLRSGLSLQVVVGEATGPPLNSRPVADTNAIKYIESIRLVQKRFHMSPPVQLQHFYTRLMAPGADPIAPLVAVNTTARRPPGSEVPATEGRSFRAGELPRAGANPVETLGTGVFRGDRLAGLLTVDETQGLLALRGEMGKVYASVPDPHEPGTRVTLRFHQENKPAFRVAFAGGKPVVHVKLQFEGEVLSVPGGTDYTLPQNRRVLERETSDFLQQETFVPLFKRVYNEWGADPVGIGQLFRSRFPTLDAWLAFAWPEHVQDLGATVEVDLFIRRFGMLLGNPKFD
ncbi:MAG TPA: Ger(x)C family spore germination protein [Symbiobacteriaceae bacterium]|nr:Ger(x)C family spore germination protein [Symbiobacteriaceae bacterium]